MSDLEAIRDAALAKIEKSARKHPVGSSRGRAPDRTVDSRSSAPAARKPTVT